ncbi:hypothetical protein EG327_006245 [Venturia inaequalis]|uniref:RING-type domain-containing protein n=1 Tax=Venturia inaequalis TaxID=5025 RepID=A0A8H3Z0Q6_VENIN|nr:hypothetical protein EG327_006245 [Venturia inaequalis]
MITLKSGENWVIDFNQKVLTSMAAYLGNNECRDIQSRIFDFSCVGSMEEDGYDTDGTVSMDEDEAEMELESMPGHSPQNWFAQYVRLRIEGNRAFRKKLIGGSTKTFQGMVDELRGDVKDLVTICLMETGEKKPANPVSFDDEMMAFALQLEEINNQSTIQKGKYKVDNPPDMELAFSTFQKEVQMHIQFLNDLNLAHSIARAVDADAQVIAETVQDEGREERDRRLALQLSGQNPDDAPPPYAEVGSAISVQQGDDQIPRLYAKLQMEALKHPFPVIRDDDEESIAGPSVSYADRQLQAFEKLSLGEIQCAACLDEFGAAEVVRTPCESTYCKGCLKEVFLNAIRDEEYFPPRSLKIPIPIELVAPYMSADELALNQQCGRFINPNQVINGDRANCIHCVDVKRSPAIFAVRRGEIVRARGGTKMT